MGVVLEAITCPTRNQRPILCTPEVSVCPSLLPDSSRSFPRPLGAVPPQAPRVFPTTGPADSRAMLITGRRREDNDLEKQGRLSTLGSRRRPALRKAEPREGPG